MPNSKLYEDIVAQRGRLETLVAKIPGFRGYHEQNARREADRILRDYLANRIEQIISKYSRLETKILGDGAGLKHMSRTRDIKQKVQSYADRLKTAAPKYSGMWAMMKITAEDLDRIYAFDEAQIRFVDKLEVAFDNLKSAVDNDEDFSEQLEALYDAAVEAIEVFSLRDDVILELGKSFN